MVILGLKREVCQPSTSRPMHEVRLSYWSGRDFFNFTSPHRLARPPSTQSVESKCLKGRHPTLRHRKSRPTPLSRSLFSIQFKTRALINPETLSVQTYESGSFEVCVSFCLNSSGDSVKRRCPNKSRLVG